MFFISKVDYRFYKKFYWPVYWISCAILLLVIVPGIGRSVNGATRWINLGFGQFQPSEITKIGLIIFFAGYLSDHKEETTEFKGFVKPLAFLIIPIGILFKVQNHLSASMVIAIITVVMMIMSGRRMLYFIGAGVLVVITGVAALFVMHLTGTGGFRLARIISFMDPFADMKNTGWQVVQSLYAIGSGGLFGVGLRRK